MNIHETDKNVDRFISLDLNSPNSIRTAVASVDTPLDGLCNNAGLPPRAGLETAIRQVNFLGTRALTTALLPHLRQGGSTVNMASRAGHGWREGAGQVKRLARLTHVDQVTSFVASEQIDATRCYNLSKEAVILWSVAESEVMRARGLRMNSLSPGDIATGILGSFQKAFGAGMARNVEHAGRPGQAAEVAQIAAFLLPPACNWIKGADIPDYGGMGAFNQSDAMDLECLRLTGGVQIRVFRLRTLISVPTGSFRTRLQSKSGCAGLARWSIFRVANLKPCPATQRRATSCASRYTLYVHPASRRFRK